MLERKSMTLVFGLILRLSFLGKKQKKLENNAKRSGV